MARLALIEPVIGGYVDERLAVQIQLLELLADHCNGNKIVRSETLCQALEDAEPLGDRLIPAVAIDAGNRTGSQILTRLNRQGDRNVAGHSGKMTYCSVQE